MEIEESQIRDLVDRFTLRLFKSGCEKVNYQILESLPTNVNSLMEELSITKAPLTRRLNQLLETRLLDWKKGTGRIERTPLTDLFLNLIDSIKVRVKDEVITQLGS